MPNDDLIQDKPAQLDYKLVFDLMPGMCVVLDSSFNIVAQNADHAKATLTTGKDVVGRWLFEVFPDNPRDWNADGVSTVRQSLLNVLKTRKPDAMPIVRYDVQPEDGGKFHTRYWAITNTPILDGDGYVRWIINRAEDVTELAELRMKKRGSPVRLRGLQRPLPRAPGNGGERQRWRGGLPRPMLPIGRPLRARERSASRAHCFADGSEADAFHAGLVQLRL